MKHLEIKHYENTLKLIIQTAKVSIEKEQNLEVYVKEFSNRTNIRISIIDDSGNVIVDGFADISTLDNHNNRAEIIDARKKEFGVITRYSEAIESDFLYVAKKIEIDNETHFIRLSMDLESIMDNFYLFWINIVISLLVSLVILFLLANKFNTKTKNELNRIIKSFDLIANKDYNQTFNFGFAREFAEIGVYLKKLSKKLQKSDKQKKKYTTKLKLANKQKSDVISAISHEFKNPIATIIGYAQTLHSEKKLDEQTKDKFLEKIVKNSQKISDIIDRLSLSAKLENGDLTPIKSRFDINENIKEIVETYKITKPDRAINYVGEETFVEVDEQMMELVIINLIDNALKYSEVDIDILLKNGIFSVQDYGIGIEKEEIEKVTKKFYRSNTRSFDNSIGLGLSFVTLILEMHDIKLQIESEVNLGSLFYFKLN
ncbi:MAG: HAMP domain-containing histidine kinase [Campylobacteraceae bacterium]|nr:HAMP domain-containing histidine kinase [Campylobacteraceae bacterium]